MANENVKALPTMGFVEATKKGFFNLFNFKGRARRSEFWWFVAPWSILLLIVLLCVGVFWIIDTFCIPYQEGMTDEEFLAMEMNNTPYDLLGVFVPLAIVLVLFCGSFVRRLHDVNIGNWLAYSIVGLYLLGVIMIYAVYYYDPMTFCSSWLLGMEPAESRVYVNLTVLPLLFIFVSLILLVVAIIICLIDGKKQGNKFGKSTK